MFGFLSDSFFVIHVILVNVYVYSSEIFDLFTFAPSVILSIKKECIFNYLCIFQVKENWMNCFWLKFAEWLKNLNNVITKCVWPPRRKQRTNWCDKTFPLKSWNETKWNFCFSQRVVLAFLRDFFVLISNLFIVKLKV